MKKTNWYFIAAACYFIAGILNLTNKNTSMGAVWMCLGASQLALASLYNKKTKDQEDKKDEL